MNRFFFVYSLRHVRRYTRRRFFGRHPLWGKGVTSSIDLIVRPAACSDVIALSRPLPGPFTLTSTSFMPNLIAFSAACWAASWPANGVLLRLPLKPLVPAVDQQSVSPLVSVMVTVVLLKLALMWAIPTVTLRRLLRRFGFALATVRDTPKKVLYDTNRAIGLSRPICSRHYRYRRSLTPFLPATVFFGPLRVRALVRVRWPRTGKPRRCRMPR